MRINERPVNFREHPIPVNDKTLWMLHDFQDSVLSYGYCLFCNWEGIIGDTYRDSWILGSIFARNYKNFHCPKCSAEVSQKTLEMY